MNRYAHYLFLLLLCGCFGNPTMMTRSTFDSILIGTPISTVTEQAGDPYRIRTRGQHTEEYEYIEKIEMGHEPISETHYFILVTDGQVVGKRETEEKPLPYNLIYEDDPNILNY